MKLEQLQTNLAIRGIVPDALVTVVSIQWFGSEALELPDQAVRTVTENSRTLKFADQGFEKSETTLLMHPFNDGKIGREYLCIG